jgi:hypothetical protein
MVQNNIISLNRGDTYEFDLTIDDVTSDSGSYQLQGEDVVYFGIMRPQQPFEEAIIKKRFTVTDLAADGTLPVVIEPEDTIDLQPGTYYYAVKIHIQHNIIHPETAEILGYVDKVHTVINKTKLFLND